MKAFIIFSFLVGHLVADQFSDYWYSGKSEVAVYELSQSRYGKEREGTMSLIYVTESFSKSKHVKLDYPQQAGKDKTTVMKLNYVKKYNTGLYPYSVMTSAFAEVGSGTLLKATTSVQEWCGHVFLQANKKGKNYHVKGFSYFESEGDESVNISKAKLEEELWVNLRNGANTIQEGSFEMVPSQEFLRLYHYPIEAQKAELQIENTETTKTITLSYEKPLKRTLTITQNKEFPNTITAWKEVIVKGGQKFETIAQLKSVNHIPYWQMNTPQYDGMRKEVGLE